MTHAELSAHPAAAPPTPTPTPTPASAAVTLHGEPAELTTIHGVTGVLRNGFLVAPDNPRDKTADWVNPDEVKNLAASFRARMQTAQTAGGFADQGGYDPRTNADRPAFERTAHDDATRKPEHERGPELAGKEPQGQRRAKVEVFHGGDDKPTTYDVVGEDTEPSVSTKSGLVEMVGGSPPEEGGARFGPPTMHEEIQTYLREHPNYRGTISASASFDKGFLDSREGKAWLAATRRQEGAENIDAAIRLQQQPISGGHENVRLGFDLGGKKPADQPPSPPVSAVEREKGRRYSGGETPNIFRGFGRAASGEILPILGTPNLYEDAKYVVSPAEAAAHAEARSEAAFAPIAKRFYDQMGQRFIDMGAREEAARAKSYHAFPDPRFRGDNFKPSKLPHNDTAGEDVSPYQHGLRTSTVFGDGRLLR